MKYEVKNMFFIYKIFPSSQTERKIYQKTFSSLLVHNQFYIMNYTVSYIRVLHPLRRKIRRKDSHEPFLQIYRIFISHIRILRFSRRKKNTRKNSSRALPNVRISNSTKIYNFTYKGFKSS